MSNSLFVVGGIGSMNTTSLKDKSESFVTFFVNSFLKEMYASDWYFWEDSVNKDVDGCFGDNAVALMVLLL